MRKIIVTLLLLTAILGAIGVAYAQPSGTHVKENGVTVIQGDVLAPAGTPDGAVSYVAAQAGR